MIEIVYKEEKKKAAGNEAFFHIPKNIRQIGEVDDNYKIYIEDYAYHYLDRISEDVCGGKIALLLGQSNWSKGITYIFIKSAFSLEVSDVDGNHIAIREEIWNRANEIMENYFQEQEVVGWFFTMPECSLEITETIYRTHMNYFGGNDKVLFMMEPIDKDEAFFRYENGQMCRQSGYYLYYERNEAMQEYMIDINENTPMESGELVSDKAVKDFREIISHKKEEKKQKTPGFVMYGATAAAVLLTLVVGTVYLGNYEKMKSAGNKVQELAAQVQEETPQDISKDQVEDAAGEVKGEDVTVTPQATATPETAAVSETPSPRETETPSPEATETPSPEATETPSPEETETPQATPSAETAADSSQSQVSNAYEIQAGDTLTSISRAVYGDTAMIDSICQLNGISQDTTIYPGETILLP